MSYDANHNELMLKLMNLSKDFSPPRKSKVHLSISNVINDIVRYVLIWFDLIKFSVFLIQRQIKFESRKSQNSNDL